MYWQTILWGGVFGSLCLAAGVSGTPLSLEAFVIDAGGQDALYKIDLEGEAVQQTISLPDGDRQWNDLAATSADPTGVYAVANGGDSAFRRLFRVDTTTGQTTSLALDAAGVSTIPDTYGWQSLVFDPEDPESGYLGLTVGGNQRDAIARFNLRTLKIERVVETTHRWAALAISSEGELIGSVEFFDRSRNVRGEGNADVYTIDPLTGQSTLRFASNFKALTGLAYHPIDGRLYAIRAFSSDDLIVIDDQTGDFISLVSDDVGSIGPNGLALRLVPEPSTALPAMVLLIGWRRRTG